VLTSTSTGDVNGRVVSEKQEISPRTSVMAACLNDGNWPREAFALDFSRLKGVVISLCFRRCRGACGWPAPAQDRTGPTQVVRECRTFQAVFAGFCSRTRRSRTNDDRHRLRIGVSAATVGARCLTAAMGIRACSQLFENGMHGLDAATSCPSATVTALAGTAGIARWLLLGEYLARESLLLPGKLCS